MVEKEAIKFIHQEEKLLRRGVMNRYTQLLFSMIALVIASPFVLKIEARFPVVSLIFVVILLLAIRAIQVSKPIYLASTLLAVGAFILECIFNFHWLAPYRELVSLISLSLFALFVGLVIAVMIQNLFSQHNVTADSVRGGICLYLLIGVFWAILFEFL
ncbi:MAG: hypothetical protein HY586_08105, partial [Candidatus Omnitrophica bacterium]|nr:hypothetical protein [Candidatus Omnitrophota bacterium]